MAANTMTVVPAPEESILARTLLSKLERAKRSKCSVHLDFEDGTGDVVVPQSALDALGQALSNIAEGESFSILPVDAELTTQQAAAQIGVSRPFLIKLLDEGQIAYRKVGTHRRIRTAELTRYKEADDTSRRMAADALAAETYEFDLI